MITARKACNLFSFLFTLVLPVFLMPTASQAQPVTVAVFQQDAKTAIIDISLARPAPSNLIVQMNMPSGNSLTKASPDPTKYDRKNNVLKWLFKKTKPGTIRIALTAHRNLTPGQIPVVVRYRDPASKEIVEVSANSN